MMKLKEGVRFGSNVFAMAAAMIVVNDIFRELGFECVITSANDGTHGTGSLHPKDGAIDIRSHDLPNTAMKQKILTLMKGRLNDSYDILLEGLNTPNEHYHLEHDPIVN